MEAGRDPLGGLNKPVVSYFYDDDIGSYQYNQGHPMKPFRVKMADQMIGAYGMQDHMKRLTIEREYIEGLDFTVFHSDDYVDVLKNLTLENKDLYADQINRFNFGEDCPVFDGMYEYCQIYTAGSIRQAAFVS
jgi:histone deacetylase 1/2